MTLKPKLLISLIIILHISLSVTILSAQTHSQTDTYLQQALSEYQQQNIQNAAILFENAVATEIATSGPRLQPILTGLNYAAHCYYLLKDYERSVHYYNTTLQFLREMKDEKGIATIFGRLGVVYKSWRKFDEAIRYFNQAIELNRGLGLDEKTSDHLNSIAEIHDDQGQKKQALEYYQQALSLDLKLGNSNHAGIGYNNIGLLLRDLGQANQALEYFNKALEIAKEEGREDQVASRSNNIGYLYYTQGKFDEAVKYYQQALTLFEKKKDPENIGLMYTNFGAVYHSWGLYDKATEYFNKALVINRELGNEMRIAINLGNIGNIHLEQRKFEQALQYINQSLEIKKRLGNEIEIGQDLGSLANIYIQKGQYSDALAAYREALAIFQKYKVPELVSTTLNNLGAVRHRLGDLQNALDYYQQALEIDNKLKNDDSLATVLNNLGTIYYEQKEYQKAIENLRASVELKDKIRQTATGDNRLHYLDSQIYTYQFLISAHLKRSDPQNSFLALEQSRAKRLLERLVKDESSIPRVSVKQVQATLPNSTLVLMFANANLKKISQIGLSSTNVVGQESPVDPFIKAVNADYHRAIGEFRESSNPLGKGGNSDEQVSSEIQTDLATIISFYHYLLSIPPYELERGMEITRKPGVSSKEVFYSLGRHLYDLLIKPMENQLAGKTELIIVPDGVLSTLPFETLIDSRGRYLVDRYRIKYAHSMAVLSYLQNRRFNSSRKPIIAFGGAIYEKSALAVSSVENNRQFTLLEKEFRLAAAKNRSVDNIYAVLKNAKWSNLPGTLREVKKISRFISDATILTGEAVSEERIKAMSLSGEMAQYKVVHFATHGLYLPSMPELSAVVLSQLNRKQKKEDGYLHMKEIAELNLQADLVNLSACETGLGRIYGGEGLVGLTQSFLIAGANATSVSLWQVDDESTSILMSELYKRAKGRNGYLQAITDVKRDFINGSFGEEYKAPYYWAPFVYYGL